MKIMTSGNNSRRYRETLPLATNLETIQGEIEIEKKILETRWMK